MLPSIVKPAFIMSKRILLFLFLFSSTSHAEMTVRITNGEWEPFMSEYSYHYGVNSHVITEAFKLEGINVEYGFFPWIRAYEQAKQGKKWQASATWWPTNETREDFLVSEPISKTSIVFFHLKSTKFNWDSVSDLKGIKIGGTLGYDYGEDFMTALKEKKITVEYVSTDELNFKKLLHGRIQVFPNDKIVGYSQIQNNLHPDEIKRLTHHPKEFQINTLNLIISKKSKDSKFLLNKFNTGLKKLKSSGRYDQMFKDLDAGKYSKHKTKWKDSLN